MTRKTNKTKSAAAAQPLTSQERARRLLAENQPGLDSEIELQRLLNQRLQALWDELQAENDPDTALLVKVAAALTTGTGRVSGLLRAQRALTGEAADGLIAAVARTLDELSTELGVTL
jgi:hypothetical protein